MRTMMANEMKAAKQVGRMSPVSWVSRVSRVRPAMVYPVDRRIARKEALLRRKVLAAVLCFFLLPAALVSCSSAPKRAKEIFTIREMCETQLSYANKEADRGNYQGAKVFLEDAWVLAVSADDPSLRIRVDLSRGNVAFSLGEVLEAQAFWNRALAEGELVGDPELAAVARIYQYRGRLLGLGDSGSGAGSRDTAAVEEIRSGVAGEMGYIKSNRLYTAMAWTVIALAEKELGSWAEAEKAARRALDIHEKERYLELAAYDCYLIASIRSVAGDYPQALAALGEAIAFDRRAENTYGLGMDWMALGDVNKKAGNISEAAGAYSRAADIFGSVGLEAEMQEARRRAEEL